ncbi:PRKCA-binding protein isoform X2 [Episyrphus balteatus]|uniref:PRKCA-binding protein isoform X2 n=1 Tax=Episyrphus balteatus TaxID=286459 RepID=UPI00248676FC|nr:PRKCA-binding protein isoform X2 [Episyrphus balteatus]
MLTDPDDDFFFEEDKMGMTLTTGTVVITKDQTNLIGISIGGGAPLCPCLYIVQVFDGTPAAKEGSLQSGDELVSVNGVNVKGKTKVEVAKMIQVATTEVTINYNKLHADLEQGKSFDILLKKIKHRFVESMSSSTADSLGLSRAILCNDSLVKRLEELEGTEYMYKGLVDHAKRMLKAYFDLLTTYKQFGDIFAEISVKEPQLRASEAFLIFGDLHRNFEKDGVNMLKAIKPILADIGTYLNKAIPDTKLTVKKYGDAKFTYLSYCLKVKEMDDEEHSFASLQESLYRVETGNYEYRLILKCRQEARSKFAQLRNDVLEKMELLESKHVNDLTRQLRGILESFAELHRKAVERLEEHPNLFPIEVDFKSSAFEYKSNVLSPHVDEEDGNEEEVAKAVEAVEDPANIIDLLGTSNDDQNELSAQTTTKNTTTEMPSVSSPVQPSTSSSSSLLSPSRADDDLLKELGLFGLDLTAGQQQGSMRPFQSTNNEPSTSRGALVDLLL